MPHNRPLLPHNFPWKCCRISHFFPHPIRSPALWRLDSVTAIVYECSWSDVHNPMDAYCVLPCFSSGEEGIYPDLIKFAEKRLEKVSPKRWENWRMDDAI